MVSLFNLGRPLRWSRANLKASFEENPVARLTVGILVGLILGLYLDSASAGGGARLLPQIETAVKNLLLH